jgi:hypothetical protein
VALRVALWSRAVPGVFRVVLRLVVLAARAIPEALGRVVPAVFRVVLVALWSVVRVVPRVVRVVAPVVPEVRVAPRAARVAWVALRQAD